MICEKCGCETSELITINNRILVPLGYNIGIAICNSCYANIPKFISVINIGTGNEECIPETMFDENIHTKINR